jgi:hypothetical protein
MTVYVLEWKSLPTEVYACRAEAVDKYTDTKRPTWERDYARNGIIVPTVSAVKDHADAIWSDAARARAAEVAQ